MKHRLLPVMAALLLCAWSASAFACEHARKTAAAKAAAVTADAKASCASKASRTTTATAAAHAGCASKAAAAAAHAGCASKAAAAAHAGCGAKGARTAVAPAESGCRAYGASVTTVAAAGHGADAVVAGGSSCRAGGATAKGDHDCDACAELALCDDELSKIGIETQVVPLKNGVMIVYTSNGHGKAQAIQNAVARLDNRLHGVTAARDKARLCAECRTMRGAMASGKLIRETVNIGGGVLTVMTSTDPKMVAKLQSLMATTKT